MFDLFFGLPLHPLVVHSFVVLTPLVALLGLVYVVWPRRRRGLRWPLLVGALVVGVVAVVTRLSGEAMRDRLYPMLAPGGPTSGTQSVWLHSEIAGIAAIVAGLWALVTIVAVWFVLKPVPGAGAEGVGAGGASDARGRARWTVPQLVCGGVVGLGALVVIGWAIAAGHTGAVAVWSEVPGIAAGEFAAGVRPA